MRLLTCVTTVMLSVVSAQADWFARMGSDGKLLVIGTAVDNDDIQSLVTITCDGPLLTMDLESRHNGQPEDLPLYEGTKISIQYKRDGQPAKMGLNGEPTATVGGILAFRARLNEEQSKEIYRSIAKGYRLDFELVHPELIHDADAGVKKIYSMGFTAPLIAMDEHCGNIGKD